MDVRERLVALGYLPPPGVASAPPNGEATTLAAEAALAAYRTFHGLPAHANVEQVWRHMLLPRCKHPDILPVPRGAAAAASPSRWPSPAIRLWCRVALAGFTADQVNDAYRAAVASWADVCGIEPTIVFAAPANIVSQVGPIDGAGRVLAWSQLPGAGTTAATTLQQLYDANEPWTTYGLSFLQEVIAHEVGHALGIGHLASGNLMQPVATGRLIVPQAGDIAEATARYGPSKVGTPPTPTPVPGPAELGGVDLGNGYRLSLTRKG